jgi:acyl-CoA synthetase (AMP-forming)/AMP-acid ligase II
MDATGHSPATLLSLLRGHARSIGDRRALLYLERGERPVDGASFAELDASARAAARSLRDSGLAHKPVLLALPPGLDFVRCFLGCLYAGAVAVPVPYPIQQRNWDRLRRIAEAARPAAILTARSAAASRNLAEVVVERRSSAPMRVLAADEVLAGTPLDDVSLPEPGDLAFIQYTSGSTSRPKGVAVTHGNIMANEAMIKAAFGHDSNTVVVSWLPLHHDMGLIGSVLQPLYVGGQCILMSPLAFLQKPVRWLWAIQNYRGTTSGAPNFGYELCVCVIDERQVAGLDLTSWQLAFCGAEPVRLHTMRRFVGKFAGCGFADTALYPCYGLAEATLFVSGRAHGSGVRHRGIGRKVTPPQLAGTGNRRELVSCGSPWLGGGVVILDIERPIALPAGIIGEIGVSGPHVSPGFWSAAASAVIPDTDRQAIVNGDAVLRTGDLGFVADGELYIAGRLKDMIIIHGTNIYAEDVEAIVSDLPEADCLRLVACFGIERDSGEAMVLVGELTGKALPADGGKAVLTTIGRAVGEAFGAIPAASLLVARGGLPVAASGKLQRGLARARYLKGALPVLAAGGPLAATLPAAAVRSTS